MNSKKQVAEFLKEPLNTIYKVENRAFKADKKEIRAKIILLYRILTNCDLDSIIPYTKDDNFNKLEAKIKLPSIKFKGQ